jgi:tRNA1(Val) A37 N6-methylase TrmN6
MDSMFLKNDETLDDLQLKGICVIQKKDTFRFGVDAVLLANFAKVKKGARILDLCSGTGIIPFILAGKTDASSIIGIEIQDEMVEMAKRSVLFNKLEDRIEFIQRDLKDLEYLKTLPQVEVVTVNPPYKLKNSGIINVDDRNAIARHEIKCTLEDVVIAAKIIMKDNGKIFMIHRPDRLADIIYTMRNYKIEPKLIRMIQPNVKQAPNMVLVEGQNNGGRFLKWEVPIYIYNLDGSYSDEINSIYGRKK